jgi:hypothetical protein
MENENVNIEVSKTPKKESFWETIRFILLAIIIVIPVRIFIAQPRAFFLLLLNLKIFPVYFLLFFI